MGRMNKWLVLLILPILNALSHSIRQSFVSRSAALFLGSLATFASRKLQMYWEQWRWSQRLFLHRIQVSLLTIAPGRVDKRTLFEGNLKEAVMNGSMLAEAMCLDAAKKCSADAPFLTQHMESRERYLLLNNCLNLVSSLSPQGHLACEIGAPYTGSWFLFAVTGYKTSGHRGKYMLNNGTYS